MIAYCQYFNVFGDRANRALHELALTKNGHFTASKTSPSKDYPDWRKSTVIYDNQLAGIKARIEAEIRARLPQVLTTLRLPRFDIDIFEIQLTSHNDGEYYHWHTDNGTPLTASRVVTFVYYFHGRPKGFTGGELVLFASDGQPMTIEPVNDSMVLFSSRTKHEVKPVVCSSRRFEDGRFTINGWVRRRTMVREDSWFGYQMFAPPRNAAANAATRAKSLSWPGIDLEATRSGAQAKGSQASPSLQLAAPYGGANELPTVAALATNVAKLESLLTLYGDLHRLSSNHASVDVRPHLTRDEFLESYYSRNRPVVLPGRLADSEAVRNWSPKYLARRFPSVSIEITRERDADPSYERNFRRSVATVTLREFVDRLIAQPESNDFYVVARNFFFANPAFAPLRDELAPPPEIIDATDRSPGSAKLWFGPKGTLTPLHHDEHSILFVQVYGRKHFKLIPSFELPKIYLEDRFYSAVDPENVDDLRFPAFRGASVANLLLTPGDVLFIPVGWWHWVRSLDVSISATFSSFHVPERNTQWKPDLRTARQQR